jgi:thioredoxin 1
MATKQEIIEAKGLVLVDFYSDNCMHCKNIEPTLKKIESKIKVIKFNIQDDMDFVQSLGISNLPTLIIFGGGKELKRFDNVQWKGDIVRAIKICKDLIN